MLESSANTAEEPDLGGEITNVDDEVICVFHDATLDAIRAVQVTVSPAGVLTPGPIVTLVTASQFNNYSRPRISKTGGNDGRYLITWESVSLLTSSRAILALAVTRDLQILGSLLSLGSGDNADVDGDGNQWVVAFERAGPAGDPDVVASAVSWSTTSSTLTATPAVNVTAITNTDEMNPAVAWLGTSALVGWERRAAPGSTDTDLFAKTVDGFTCAQCQPTELLVNTASIEDQFAMAASPGAVPGTAALVVWHYGANAGSIGATEFLSADGDNSLHLFGPSCGVGGIVTSGCPRVGNADFRVRLTDAMANTTSWLVLSLNSVALTCGPCTLVADPFDGFVSGAINTDGNGAAASLVAIPNSSSLSGLRLFTQWIVAPPVGACSYVNADFSNCAIVRIQ